MLYIASLRAVDNLICNATIHAVPSERLRYFSTETILNSFINCHWVSIQLIQIRNLLFFNPLYISRSSEVTLKIYMYVVTTQSTLQELQPHASIMILMLIKYISTCNCKVLSKAVGYNYSCTTCTCTVRLKHR